MPSSEKEAPSPPSPEKEAPSKARIEFQIFTAIEEFTSLPMGDLLPASVWLDGCTSLLQPPRPREQVQSGGRWPLHSVLLFKHAQTCGQLVCMMCHDPLPGHEDRCKAGPLGASKCTVVRACTNMCTSFVHNVSQKSRTLLASKQLVKPPHCHNGQRVDK